MAETRRAEILEDIIYSCLSSIGRDYGKATVVTATDGSVGAIHCGELDFSRVYNHFIGYTGLACVNKRDQNVILVARSFQDYGDYRGN